MKIILIQEPNDVDSIFLYIENFIDKTTLAKLTPVLHSIDYIPNYNYSETKIIRYQKWFQTNKKYFCDTWKTKFKRWEASEYFPELAEFQRYITHKIKELGLDAFGIDIPEFNSCLINKYLNNHYIREHRDTDRAFGKEPLIAGISLGEAATIIFKRVKYTGANKSLSKRDKDNEYLNFKLTLKPNSLFIMAGSSQKYWTHQIPKITTLTESNPRISLTFRKQIFVP